MNKRGECSRTRIRKTRSGGPKGRGLRKNHGGGGKRFERKGRLLITS